MKKIILMVFLVLGVMSFSVMDKVIIVVQNDNYETPFITGTYSRGMLADTLFSGSKDSGVGESIYNQVYKTNKITFVIEKYEEGTLVKVLKYFEKKEYNGKIEVIEIAELENTKMREIITKNDWNYSVYMKATEVPGEYKTKEGTFTKADAVNDFLFNLKKQLK